MTQSTCGLVLLLAITGVASSPFQVASFSGHCGGCMLPDLEIHICHSQCNLPEPRKPEDDKCIEKINKEVNKCQRLGIKGKCDTAAQVALCILQHICFERCASHHVVKINVQSSAECVHIDLSVYTCDNLNKLTTSSAPPEPTSTTEGTSTGTIDYDMGEKSAMLRFGLPMGITCLVGVLLVAVFIIGYRNILKRRKSARSRHKKKLDKKDSQSTASGNSTSASSGRSKHGRNKGRRAAK